MKIAVIGSRTFDDYNRLKRILDLYPATTIVSGGAHGADSLGERYAMRRVLRRKSMYHSGTYLARKLAL